MGIRDIPKYEEMALAAAASAPKLVEDIFHGPLLCHKQLKIHHKWEPRRLDDDTLCHMVLGRLERHRDKEKSKHRSIAMPPNTYTRQQETYHNWKNQGRINKSVPLSDPSWLHGDK